MTTLRHRRTQITLKLAFLLVALVVVCVAGVALGSTNVPLASIWKAVRGIPIPAVDALIIHDIRMPRTVTATLAGASLGVAGLQMQTLFRNPLADPYILGVSSGATFGVACVLLLAGGVALPVLGSTNGLDGSIGLATAASAGAAAVMGVILVVGRFVKSSTTLLLLGVMLSALVGSLVTVLLAAAQPDMVAEFVRWGFGSYQGTSWQDISVLVPVLATMLLAGIAMAPWLNVLHLGERYAGTLGVNVRLVRTCIIIVSSVLAGTTTAFCGPISFLGIAIPHLARSWFRTSDHRLLVPATILLGASLALAVEVLANLPGTGVLPLNAANAVVGAPIVMWVLVRSTRKNEL